MRLVLLAIAALLLAWLLRRALPLDGFEPLPTDDDEEYRRLLEQFEGDRW
jgi:hypothetical protein